MRLKPIFILSIALMSTLSRCNLPEMKSLKYSGDSEKVEEDLKHLGKFKQAGVLSTTESYNGHVTYSLTITLYNGKSIPADEEGKEEMARKAMKIVVDAIENESEYDLFLVKIVDDFDIGIFSKTEYSNFEFTKEEIEELKNGTGELDSTV